MIKAVMMLKRADGLSFDAFKTWWLTEHAALTRDIPGLRRANFCPALGDGEADYDGVAELWFENERAFTDAFASAAWQRATASSTSMIDPRIKLLVDEQTVSATVRNSDRRKQN